MYLKYNIYYSSKPYMNTIETQRLSRLPLIRCFIFGGTTLFLFYLRLVAVLEKRFWHGCLVKADLFDSILLKESFSHSPRDVHWARRIYYLSSKHPASLVIRQLPHHSFKVLDIILNIILNKLTHHIKILPCFKYFDINFSLIPNFYKI